MIELDGTYQEGGGALVRVALALSALTQKEFHVTNIRAGREESGLKPQHLTAINALKEMCDAETNRVSIGSTELTFKPGTMKKGAYSIDIGTAGSISLLLQAVLLPCLFAPGKMILTVKGGTCGKWQASADYLQNILLPHLARFAEKITLKIIKRGYYPKGGGEIVLEITPRFKELNSVLGKIPSSCPAINLVEQGKLEQIRGVVNASSELAEKEVAERIQRATVASLKKYNVPINIRIEYASSPSIGGEIVLWALFSTKGEINSVNPVILGSSALIEKGISSEQIGKNAAEELAKEIDSCAAVDQHLADQLIPYMALLPGSKIVPSKITSHAKTNIYVSEKFLSVQFKIDGKTIAAELRNSSVENDKNA